MYISLDNKKSEKFLIYRNFFFKIFLLYSNLVYRLSPISDKGDNNKISNLWSKGFKSVAYERQRKNPIQSVTYAPNGVSKSYTVSPQNDKKWPSTKGCKSHAKRENPTKSMTYVCWHGGCYPWGNSWRQQDQRGS